MKFSDHKDLGNRLLQLRIQLIEHPVCIVYPKFLQKAYYTIP